jgi:hypothetical protein
LAGYIGFFVVDITIGGCNGGCNLTNGQTAAWRRKSCASELSELRITGGGNRQKRQLRAVIFSKEADRKPSFKKREVNVPSSEKAVGIETLHSEK